MEEKTRMTFPQFDKNACCGCGACSLVCGETAITMREDDYGFRYPELDLDKCVGCHICKNVCNYRYGKTRNDLLKAYAGASKDREILNSSTSGGVFTEVAKWMFENNGIVYGAVFQEKNNEVTLLHKVASNIAELEELKGSKYIPSNVEMAYLGIEKHLKNNVKVLFCGTACQVDGLYGFLRKEYKNLLTIDIVCHGVPSPKVFNDYLESLRNKYRAKKVRFKFRSKKVNGWQHGGVITLETKKKKAVEKKISYMLSPFYMSFMKGQILRYSCFSCKYAGKDRPADITLGDYWGVQREQKEILIQNGGQLEMEQGISCILINSKKGAQMIQAISDRLNLYETTFGKISKGNPALCQPATRPSDWELYYKSYFQNGYSEIERLYRKKYSKQIPMFYIKSKMPNWIKRKLKKNN
jgi:coenzyme F420-reducing hydrogenase beta subunit